MNNAITPLARYVMNQWYINASVSLSF